MLSWPTLVLSGGVVLSLAANLDQAQPTTWGRITAATPAATFLVAISMLERRTTQRHDTGPIPAVPPVPAQDGQAVPALPSAGSGDSSPRPAATLLDSCGMRRSTSQ